MDIKVLDKDWKEKAKENEALHYKRKYERTVRLCKAIWEYNGTIWAIKHHLLYSEEPAASELWNNLDYEVQRLLITAPTYGGAFTTAEVKKIRELWEVTADDIG